MIDIFKTLAISMVTAIVTGYAASIGTVVALQTDVNWIKESIRGDAQRIERLEEYIWRKK